MGERDLLLPNSSKKVHYSSFYGKQLPLQVNITGRIPDHNLELTFFHTIVHIDIVKTKFFGGDIKSDCLAFSGL